MGGVLGEGESVRESWNPLSASVNSISSIPCPKRILVISEARKPVEKTHLCGEPVEEGPPAEKL